MNTTKKKFPGAFCGRVPPPTFKFVLAPLTECRRIAKMGSGLFSGNRGLTLGGVTKTSLAHAWLRHCPTEVDFFKIPNAKLTQFYGNVNDISKITRLAQFGQF